MKKCIGCKKEKPLDEFYPCKGTKDGRQYKCIECFGKERNRVERRHKFASKRDVQSYLLRSARNRAHEKGIDFNLELEDIVVPEVCPITGLKMIMAIGKLDGASYTLDRVDDSKGYVKGNVRVISWKANYAKSKLTLQEIERLYLYSKGQL